MGTVDAAADSPARSDEPEFITIKAACKKFSVSYPYLHNAILDGRLRSLRPSRQHLLAPADVRALLVADTEARAR